MVMNGNHFPSGHSGISASLTALFMEMMYSDDPHFEINITDIKKED